MVIGLTGTNGAGKTAAADYLKSRGFQFHSLSDEIRRELDRRNQSGSRENLIEMGNRLRAEYGPAVLAERVKARLSPDQNYVVDSIRNPYEVESLRARGGFHLLHVDAPVEVRYERVRRRGGLVRRIHSRSSPGKKSRKWRAPTPAINSCGPVMKWRMRR